MWLQLWSLPCDIQWCNSLSNEAEADAFAETTFTDVSGSPAALNTLTNATATCSGIIPTGPHTSVVLVN